MALIQILKLIGRETRVNVMDCEAQLELQSSWTLGKFIETCFNVDPPKKKELPVQVQKQRFDPGFIIPSSRQMSKGADAQSVTHNIGSTTGKTYETPQKATPPPLPLSQIAKKKKSPASASNNNNNNNNKAPPSLCPPLSHGHGPLNVISLEISNLAPAMLKQVKSPQFVRSIDWIDNAWPASRRGLYKKVSEFCFFEFQHWRAVSELV